MSGGAWLAPKVTTHTMRSSIGSLIHFSNAAEAPFDFLALAACWASPLQRLYAPAMRAKTIKADAGTPMQAARRSLDGLPFGVSQMPRASMPEPRTRPL